MFHQWLSLRVGFLLSFCLLSRMLLVRAFIGLIDRKTSTITCDTRKMFTTLSLQRPTGISIVGGGLAGLSTAYHFLDKVNDSSIASVTIYDKCNVGEGGASAVAGGLLHPLAPKGNKLAHWGLEGLQSTRRLVKEAAKFSPDCVLREKLYRVALTEENVQHLYHTATEVLPEHCRWVEKDELDQKLGIRNSMGGVELLNGCCVIHVPSYLKGLLAACREKGNVQWKIVEEEDYTEILSLRHQELETNNDENEPLIWACGAGVIQQREYFEESVREAFPLQIVRGQSVELTPTTKDVPLEAALCGKYVSPLPGNNRMVVGASQEFKKESLSPDELVEFLKSKSYELAPALWDNSIVDNITCGYRAQSNRGALGRVPMIGQMNNKDWIFTGLSNRGLLHHGIYGEKLVDMLLASYKNDSGTVDCPITKEYPHLDWWKKKMR